MLLYQIMEVAVGPHRDLWPHRGLAFVFGPRYAQFRPEYLHMAYVTAILDHTCSHTVWSTRSAL